MHNGPVHINALHCPRLVPVECVCALECIHTFNPFSSSTSPFVPASTGAPWFEWASKESIDIVTVTTAFKGRWRSWMRQMTTTMMVH